MLSEKAKGKQRAIDPLPAPPPEPAPIPARELTIRFTEGIADLLLTIAPAQSVRDIKSNIRQARPQLRDRRLRLIHSGRLLTDGTFLYEWLTSLEERQRRVRESEKDGMGAGHVGANNMWLHCSVGPVFERDGEEGEEGKMQTAQLQPLRGFDRLTAAGFSESDIANFRRQFHNESSSNYLDSTEFSTEEEYDDHARALEEQWIDSLDTNTTASLSQSSSSSSSILQGILLGFFFPLIPFFFMREPKMAVFWESGEENEESGGSVIFSKRMQMGLVMGFLINILFGMWRFLLDSS